MDTLFWTQFSPKITLDHTIKKFYGKYLYRLVVYAPSGYLINQKNSSIQEGINRRKLLNESARLINYAGYWGEMSVRHNITDANPEFLELIKSLKNNRTFKIRAEEPRIQIYAKSELDIQNLVNNNKQLFQQYTESFSGPADYQAEQVLNSGAIIKNTDNGYKHKVILRDGRYDVTIKHNILNYLTNCGTELVLISPTVTEMLSNQNNYIWSCSFYTNDPSVVTFISLMSPTIILNIHELVVMPHK